MLIGAAVAVAAIVAGGLFFVTRGDDEDDRRGSATTEPLDDTERTEPADSTRPTSSVARTTGFTLPDLTVPGPSTSETTASTASTASTTDVPSATTTPDATLPPAPGGIPAPTEEPTGLGSDPELDELAQHCYDGGLIACDELWAISPAGSEYEAYAFTCAGRQPVDADALCSRMAGFPVPTMQPSDLPTGDADLVRRAFRCWAGNMQVCDELYRDVPTTSPFSGFGDTCAGRQPAGSERFCTGTFPEWERLSVPIAHTPADPTDLGTDPELDALAISCYGGDFEACDDLYLDSAVDSDYETYGSTCGGRLDEETFGGCVERLDIEPLGGAADPAGLGTDADLDTLARSCFGSDMAACDTLYFRSAIASDYETYGSTCGGRIEEEVRGECQERYG